MFFVHLQSVDVRSVYDALQLQACKVSPSSNKNDHANLPHRKAASIIERQLERAFFFVFVAGDVGTDDNPGTVEKPVKTIKRALQISRSQKVHLSHQKVIYLAPGNYFLNETVDLYHGDSNLMFLGDGHENTFVSGGKEYTFMWKEFVREMGPLQPGINAVYDTVQMAGSSNSMAKYVGRMDSSQDCRKACDADDACFVFTWHDSTKEAFANMCYFRADGLWTARSEKGVTSGKKVNIVVADLSNQNPIPFTSLFLNGRRAVRARYPDGNPETMGLHTIPSGYVAAAVKWLHPSVTAPGTEIHIQDPVRNGTHFPEFQIGIGGSVSVFDPPESYWGTAHPTGGGEHTYYIPTGLEYSDVEGFVNRTWKHPHTGVVHAFQCEHWGNWQFAIKGRDSPRREIYFDYGGYQEARGCLTGAEWYVENIFEELDAPGEWFYDETEKKLYLYPNGTLPSSGVGTNLNRLVNIRGSIDSPVYNITLMNITFTHTQPTYFEPHEVPSGGDWSIHRGGAVFAEGVDGFVVYRCGFFSPGGNGLFLSNYVRRAIIENSEFVYIGESAIASIGSAELIDGTSENQPRGNSIMGNLIHEIGIFGKQTSAYVQSLTCETVFSNNVFFNGPRAGINFNDGFGGGNKVSYNLGFNLVRETGDHGPFNSWDRQPYLTRIKDGKTPSLDPAISNLTHNFFINNYHSTWPIDHDDGSCYYYDTYNFLVYGGYKNYLGHSKVVKYNVYVFPDASHSLESLKKKHLNVKAFFSRPFCANSDGASTGDLPSGWGEVWSNNTCVIGNPNVYEFNSCDPGKPLRGIVPMTANNKFYAPEKDVYFKCGSKQFSLSDYQKLGYDIGSTVEGMVDTDTIIKWGKILLGS